MSHETTLEELFRHDAEARALEARLLGDADRDGVLKALAAATEEARARDDAEGEARLERLAGIWGQIGGPKAAATLTSLLGHDMEPVRLAAGGALLELAATSFDDVAEAVRRLLDDGGEPTAATFELPLLLAEVEDPKVVDLVLALLAHRDPEVVAASLEVAGELGWDERIRGRLEELCEDARPVVVPDDEEGEVEMSVGELASEIVDTLRTLWQGKRR